MGWVRSMTVIAAFAIVAVGCGDDDKTASPVEEEPTTESQDSEAETETGADADADADNDADAEGDADADAETDEHDHEHGAGAVLSEPSESADAAFDLIATSVAVAGDEVVFRSEVIAEAGTQTPEPVGDLDQAPVWSYVWPTTLDSSVIGFDPEQGIVALAATSHPDFDDTPLYDEDNDGDVANDGALWHTHWVVLTESPECEGGLSVRGIPDGATPTVPATWPELPILIDSPDIATHVAAETVEIRVPVSELGPDLDFGFDGVTAGLRVSTSPHDPLLCVEAVFDVASGDLSLPGTVDR